MSCTKRQRFSVIGLIRRRGFVRRLLAIRNWANGIAKPITSGPIKERPLSSDPVERAFS